MRIKPGGFRWCDLDPDNPDHVRKFKRRVPGLPPPSAKKAKSVTRSREHQPKPRRKKQPDFGDELANFELGMQEIRLCYLRWITHPDFKPPRRPFGSLAARSKYQVLKSPTGDAFTLSPCGWGSIYLGGGKGSASLPNKSEVYPDDPALLEKTRSIRARLDQAMFEIRQAAMSLIDAGDQEEVWALLQDYFWVKLGVHEYAFDLLFDVPMKKTHTVRNLLVDSLRRGEDLRHTWYRKNIKVEELKKFIRATRWNRYACCSFDCGPIAISRNGFVRFGSIAEDRKTLKAPGQSASGMVRSRWSRKLLEPHYHLLALYDEQPLAGVTTYETLESRRAEILEFIEQTQESLRTASRRR